MVNQSYTNDGGFAKSGNAIGNRKVQKPKAPITVQPVKSPSYTQASKATGPYIPGISDNPAALKSASGSNVTTNKTAFPATTSQGLPGYYNSNGGVVEATKNLANTKIVSDGRNGEVVLTNAGKKALQNNLDLLNGPAGSGGGYNTTESNTSAVTPSSVVRPELLSGPELAKQLGLVYDRSEIEKNMVDAIAAKYANLDTEFGRTQDAYYDSVASNADALLGTLKRGDRNAAISGASSGSQAATQLSAILGIGQQNAQGATELAQGRGDLVTKRETENAEAKVKALKDYNDLGLTLGERISSIYNADMVGYSADKAGEASTNSALIAKDASNYAADQGLKGATAAANASVAAAAKYGSNTAAIDPNANVNQEIANIYTILQGNLTPEERAAYMARLNALTGVNTTKATNNANSNKNKTTTGGGFGYNAGNTIGTGKIMGGP